jgi:hypothetical protein
MHDALDALLLAHDGPAPAAELAAARWGAGAARRLARGAVAALAEARLRACIAARARLRPGPAAAAGRLCESAMIYRRLALAAGR